MTRKPNILFVNIPGLGMQEVRRHCEGKGTFYYLVMPMGILYVSAYTRKKGAFGAIHLLDYARELRRPRSGGTVAEFIAECTASVPFRPDIVAFSVPFTPGHEFLVLAAEKFKELWPEAVIVAGGHHATNCVAKLFESPHIDYVIRGEGEVGFAEFTSAWPHQDEKDIAGVYSRSKAATVPPTQICSYIDDLDEIPWPDWQILDMEGYLGSGATRAREFGGEGTEKARRVATFSSNRGCPFSCTFCASHKVHGRSMRFRTPEDVICELEALRDRFGANVFFPCDDLFTANKKKVKEILTGFRDRLPGCELQAPGGLSVNTLDHELLDLFIATGTKVITLAVESGSEYVQREVIKKRCNLDKARDLVAYLRARDVVVRCFFIIGFPHETQEQMRETVQFAYDLKADWSAIAIAAPLPGSEIFAEFVEMGAIPDDVTQAVESFGDQRNFDTPDASADEIADLAYFGNLRVNFFGNPNKREGKYRLAIDLYKDVTDCYHHHIAGLYCMMECHEALGEEAESRALFEKIHSLILENPRSARMYQRAGHLMPRLDHDRLAAAGHFCGQNSLAKAS